MKKNNKRILALVVTLSLCLGAVIGAGAISTLVNINAQLNYGINVKYNGEKKTLTDASGAETVPITYNGTTYLPVRSIANLLSVPVNWDGNTQTVELGDTGNGVDMIDTCLPYYHFTDHNGKFSHVQTAGENSNPPMNLSNISHWIYMFSYGANNPTIASYDLGGRYNTLTFRYIVTTENYGDTTLEILGDDGINLTTIDLKASQVAQTATVNLRNTHDLSFRLNSYPYNSLNLTMFSMSLK